MFSSQSPANLKIVGAAGHSAESLRDEVARGGKFVIYSYNFSLLIVSFKRPSDIYFIKPGENAALKSWPFTLLSLVLGWWGIPWGIIYTFQSLFRNLGGGLDVTEAVLADIAPQPATPPLVGATGAATSTRPLPYTPPPPPPPPSWRRRFAVGGVLLVVLALIWPTVCFIAGRDLDVALVSGLPQPYSIELNGETYQLQPNQPVLLNLAEGDFVLRGAPGAKEEQRFSVHTPFFARPLERQSLVINPDRVAVLYRESVRYYPTGSNPGANDRPDFAILTNELIHVMPKPDYFFTPAAKQISLSSNKIEVKSHVSDFGGESIDTLAPIIREKLGPEGLRRYLTTLAQLRPEDERLLREIVTSLSHAEARQLLETRLRERPVLVEWHRAYQYLMEINFPEVDLLRGYESWAKASPEDGALLYLYGRLIDDKEAANAVYERALKVKATTPYAAYALGVAAAGQGNFEAALEQFSAAEALGLHSEALKRRTRDALLALNRIDEALARVRAQRATAPADVELFSDELTLTTLQNPDRTSGESSIIKYFAGAPKSSPADYAIMKFHLRSRLLYSLGDEKGAALLTSKVPGAGNAFEAAVGHRDHYKAASALGKTEIPAYCYWLLIMISRESGDEDAEEKYFAGAMDSMNKSDKSSREIVRALVENTPASHAEVLRTPGYSSELRVMFTALGLRYPEHRADYFNRAQMLDHDPAFPHLLLQSARAAVVAKASVPTRG